MFRALLSSSTPVTCISCKRPANLTTPQHLPFRFYDHARRGSSDPTVQRSVFASVDKVPGFAVAQCINQHHPSPLSSPSPSSGSGSTGRCDSVAASSASTPSVAQSPSDDSSAPEAAPHDHFFLVR